MTDKTALGSPVTRRKLLLGATFLAAAGIAAARQPSVRVNYLGKKELEDVIPKTIGPWSFLSSSGLVVPPEDQLSRITYSQLLTRAYVRGDEPPIMLLVAQSSSQSGILQVHRPETCYTAMGFQLSAIEPHRIATPSGRVEAVSLSATNGAKVEHVVYWTRIGDRMPVSWREQKIAVALDNLEGRIPDAVLARVSTFGNDKADAVRRMDAFVQSLMQSVDPATRRVLVA